MTVNEQLLRQLIDAANAAIDDAADELTALDRAIGDGDHGLNMRRGFGAVAAAAEDIVALPMVRASPKRGGPNEAQGGDRQRRTEPTG